MTTKRSIKKWCRSHEQFILDCMCDGMQPAEIFRVHKDKLPSQRTFDRQQVKDLAFKAEVDAAYTVIYMNQIQELEDISLLTATETLKRYDKILDDGPKAFAEAAEFKKSRIDALKFSIAKIAAIMSPRFATKQQVEHSGAVTSQFVITNYALPQVVDITHATIELDKGE